MPIAMHPLQIWTVLPPFRECLYLFAENASHPSFSTVLFPRQWAVLGLVLDLPLHALKIPLAVPILRLHLVPRIHLD